MQNFASATMDALGQRKATKIMVLFWLVQRESLDIDLEISCWKNME
jgi:hypothetical protein